MSVEEKEKMIATYLYDISELDRMGDIIVLNVKDYSFRNEKIYSIEEVLSIKKLTNKKVFVSLTPLYHEDEIDNVSELIEKIKDVDGIIFQDLGLMNTFRKLGITDKAYYAPETFVTTSLDKNFFEEAGLTKFQLSREITLSDINSILSNKGNTTYMYSAFGYQMMFYSYRNHFTNFKKHYDYDYDLRNRFDLSIKEESRVQMFKSIEDERGFRVYREKPFNAYHEMKDLNMDILLLDRIFMDDETYFDGIRLFKGEIDEKEFYSLHQRDLFEKGYLYKKTGLLKEKENV